MSTLRKLRRQMDIIVSEVYFLMELVKSKLQFLLLRCSYAGVSLRAQHWTN